MPTELTGQRPTKRFPATGPPREDQDAVAVEEPLEIRIAGDPVAVTMRTPGHDAQLAAGFLYAEGIIRSAADLGSIRHCGRVEEDGYGNALDVLPAAGVQLDLERVLSTRRGTLTTTACGVCGRRSVDDLLARVPALPLAERLSRALIAAAPERLRQAQRAFDRTGGTHAAALLAADGEVLAVHEDVGRHNAVDKVVGTLLLRGAIPPGRDAGARRAVLLVVSGRSSFEMVQKAAVARVPVLASVGATSTLAVDLAERSGVTLASFVRNGAFNVYTHPARLTD